MREVRTLGSLDPAEPGLDAASTSGVAPTCMQSNILGSAYYEGGTFAYLLFTQTEDPDPPPGRATYALGSTPLPAAFGCLPDGDPRKVVRQVDPAAICQ